MEVRTALGSNSLYTKIYFSASCKCIGQLWFYRFNNDYFSHCTVYIFKQPRQKKIGITKPQKYSWLLIALVLGLVASILLYFLGKGLYGNSNHNWYNYIGKSYDIPKEIKPGDKTILFIIMTFTGMTFSLMGEELFFRGILRSSFEKSIGEKKASIADSAAFACTHISHFGLVFTNNKWDSFTTPTLIWVASMFLVSILFFVCRKYSGSILGAVICHSAFNLGMIYCIFYPM